MDRPRTTRRAFLRSAVIGAVSTTVFPHIVPSSVLSGAERIVPSDRVTLGLIGTGNINGQHREAFLAEKDVRIVAVCDPVVSRRQAFRDRVNQAYGGNICVDYHDFRDLLTRQDIDAVCIGTPDHGSLCCGRASCHYGLQLGGDLRSAGPEGEMGREGGVLCER